MFESGRASSGPGKTKSRGLPFNWASTASAAFDNGTRCSRRDFIRSAGMTQTALSILTHSKGYDTQLGENGARLSAGQRQRVALARCLFGEPVMFVLDEPNSNLDAEGEAALDHAIRVSMARGASVVVIAHRPSALASIQQIMVLSDGKMAALGPRDDIMRKVLQAAPAGKAQHPQGPQKPQLIQVN